MRITGVPGVPSHTHTRGQYLGGKAASLHSTETFISSSKKRNDGRKREEGRPWEKGRKREGGREE